MSINEALFSSKTDLWSTPQDLFDKLNEEFHFEIDVCALPGNAKCKRYFTPEIDGLRQNWTGICWMNPPYQKPEEPCKKNCKKKKCKDRGYHIDEYIPGASDWIKKAYESSRVRGATVVCLLPVRSDTDAFHRYCMKADEIRLIEGRLHFGDGQGTAPFPSMIVIFRGSPIYNFLEDSPHVTAYKLQ